MMKMDYRMKFFTMASLPIVRKEVMGTVSMGTVQMDQALRRVLAKTSAHLLVHFVRIFWSNQDFQLKVDTAILCNHA